MTHGSQGSTLTAGLLSDDSPHAEEAVDWAEQDIQESTRRNTPLIRAS